MRQPFAWKGVIWDTPRCMAEQKVTSKVSHATIACIMTDPILLRFQACLKADSYFLLLKKMGFTLGRDLCKTEGFLMD